MLTDEQLAVIEAVYRTGDIHLAIAAHIPAMSGETLADAANREKYWLDLRNSQAGGQYYNFVHQEALANGGVTLADNVAALYADIRTAQDDMERLRRILSQTPGAPSALASMTATVIKARELQAKASGLYARRETSATGDDDTSDSAKVRGVKVEWV